MEKFIPALMIIYNTVQYFIICYNPTDLYLIYWLTYKHKDNLQFQGSRQTCLKFQQDLF